MLHIGAIAPEVGDNRLAILRVFAHFARQRQQFQALLEIYVRDRPSARDGGPSRLLALLDRVGPQLHVRAKAAALQQDGDAIRVVAERLAVRRNVALVVLVAAEGTGEAALGIVRAADKRAELAELQRQLARAARGADPAIDLGAVLVRPVREQIRPQHFVDRVDDVRHAEF